MGRKNCPVCNGTGRIHKLSIQANNVTTSEMLSLIDKAMEFRRLESNNEMSANKTNRIFDEDTRFSDSINIKPGLFGVGIDLKKLSHWWRNKK